MTKYELNDKIQLGEMYMYITDEELIKKGFVKYPKTPFQSDSVIYNFQKCYRDKEGNKLYFLDVHKWDFSWAKVPVHEMHTYEISAQLYRKGDHGFFDITFGTDFTIEEVEEFINKLFMMELIEAYEEIN